MGMRGNSCRRSDSTAECFSQAMMTRTFRSIKYWITGMHLVACPSPQSRGEMRMVRIFVAAFKILICKNNGLTLFCLHDKQFYTYFGRVIFIGYLANVLCIKSPGIKVSLLYQKTNWVVLFRDDGVRGHKYCILTLKSMF